MTNWQQITASGGFPKRDDANGFVFNGKLWLSNGYDVGNVALRDLYNSTDGETWTLVNSSTPYAAYAPICPLGAWIYVADNGKVLKTQDGVSFTTIATSGIPPYSPTCQMHAHQGELTLVTEDEIWRSADGATWTSHAVPWGPRLSHKSIVFNGRLFVIAGASTTPNSPQEGGYNYTSFRDVWSTANPENPDSWVNHGNAPFAPRMWPGLVVLDGYLYVTGGYDNVTGNGANFKDTWRTPDGDRWQSIPVSAAYTARHAPTMFELDGSILIVAGNTNTGTSTQTDIWKLNISRIGMYDTLKIKNSGNSSELVSSMTPATTAGAATKYVLFSLDLNDGGNIAEGDIIKAFAEFEATTQESTYNTGVFCQLILADSASATTGTEITEANGRNLTPATHHDTFVKTGSIAVTDTSKHYLNLVAYAVSTSGTQPVIIEQDFGRMWYELQRDPDYVSPTPTEYRYYKFEKTNAPVGGFYFQEFELYDASGKITLSSTMFSQSGLQSFNGANLVDGVAGTPNAFYVDTSPIGSYLKVDLGAGNARAVNKARFYVNGAVTATWTIKGSNDDSTYTTLATGFDCSGGAGWKEKVF